MHNKQNIVLTQKPQLPAQCGYIHQSCKFKIPTHFNGQLGYMAGQIKDPFLRINRQELIKRRELRQEYLNQIDRHQLQDLV